MKKKKKAKKKRTASASRRGTIIVSLARLSQDVERIEIRRGGTLKDALLASGFATRDLEGMLEGVRVNNRVAPLKMVLKSGDLISVAPRVQGGKKV